MVRISAQSKNKYLENWVSLFTVSFCVKEGGEIVSLIIVTCILLLKVDIHLNSDGQTLNDLSTFFIKDKDSYSKSISCNSPGSFSRPQTASNRKLFVYYLQCTYLI